MVLMVRPGRPMRARKEVRTALYTNLLIMFLAAGFIGAAALLVGALLGPKKASSTKLAAYESGIPASGSARQRFPVHFYLVAMLFIVFDIETAFFYPLAVKFKAAPQFFVRPGGDLRNHPGHRLHLHPA